MKKDKYLPIGSVVLLDNAEHRLMIIGYMVTADSGSKKVYDYMGCSFPEGVYRLDKTIGFDHSQIKTIYYIGYDDPDAKKFVGTLKAINEKYVDGNGDLNKSVDEIIKDIKSNGGKI